MVQAIGGEATAVIYLRNLVDTMDKVSSLAKQSAAVVSPATNVAKGAAAAKAAKGVKAAKAAKGVAAARGVKGFAAAKAAKGAAVARGVKETAASTATHISRAAGFKMVSLGAVGLTVSVYDLVNASVLLSRNTKSPAGEQLRRFANNLDDLYDVLDNTPFDSLREMFQSQNR